MSLITHVLPATSEATVCLGFEIKFDKDAELLDTVYRALAGIPGSRVEYLGSKKIRADLKVRPKK